MWHVQWLRRLIRRHTRKIPAEKAVNWKQRLSVAYMILTWHAFGLVVYMCYTGRRDWVRSGGFVADVDIPPARSWAHTLGVKNAQVIRVSGLNVDRYEIREDDGYDVESILYNKSGEKVTEDEELLDK